MVSDSLVSEDIISDVSCLMHNMQTFSFFTMLPFSDDVLTFIDLVHKKLHCPRMKFKDVFLILPNSLLIGFIQNLSLSSLCVKYLHLSNAIYSVD